MHVNKDLFQFLREICRMKNFIYQPEIILGHKVFSVKSGAT